MRLTTLDRELTHLAPAPGPVAVDAAHAQVMAAIATGPDAAATPDDGHDRVVPLDRARTRRRVALRLGIAAALAAASVAGVVLWPHPTADWLPAAYADWRAVPQPVGDAQAQANRCRGLEAAMDPQLKAKLDGLVPGSTPTVPVADMTPAVTERRGTWTYALLTAGQRGSLEESTLICLMSDDPHTSGRWMLGSHTSTPLPTPDQVSLLTVSRDPQWTDIYGYTGDNVARVTATLSNGVVVDTTVSHGYFAAWWPTASDRAAGPFTLTWYLTNGTRGGTDTRPIP